MNLVYLLFAVLAGRAAAGVISEIRPSGPRKYLLDITGNETLLEDDLDGILKQASLLRNNDSCEFGFKWFKGAHGAVASIEFSDKTRWAVKLSENSESYRSSIARAHDSVSLIKDYCPNIPVPQIRGQMFYTRSQSLVYYFMDWVDGIPLYSYETVLQPGSDTEKSAETQDIITLPSTTIMQFASFVYNLTTCPIPRDKSAQSYASCFNLSLNLAERALQHPIAALKARIINSTALLLSSPEDVLAPLEKMLTLAWTSKELRSSNYNPFVLSHWDLRPPNILIDPYHNIKGIVDWDNVCVRPLSQAAVSLVWNTFFSRFGTVEVSMKHKRNSFTKSLKDLNGKEEDRKTSQFPSGNQCEITFYSDLPLTPERSVLIPWEIDILESSWRMCADCPQRT